MLRVVCVAFLCCKLQTSCCLLRVVLRVWCVLRVVDLFVCLFVCLFLFGGGLTATQAQLTMSLTSSFSFLQEGLIQGHCGSWPVDSNRDVTGKT